jgi:GTPase
LTDTVGFVRHLPHQLVEAFRSTLEEVSQADLLLHVVDGAHEDPEGQLAAVREVLRDIDASGVPEIVVINKADVADPMVLARLLRSEPHSVVVSAATGQGIDELLTALERDLPRPRIDVSALVPYARGDLVARAHRDGVVLSAEHTSDGTRLHALVGAQLAAELGVFPDDGLSTEPAV